MKNIALRSLVLIAMSTATASVALAQDVAAGESRRQGRFLDREGGFDSAVGKDLGKVFGHTEGAKSYGHIQTFSLIRTPDAGVGFRRARRKSATCKAKACYQK